jgi:lysophospholipase L1-like esterase
MHMNRRLVLCTAVAAASVALALGRARAQAPSVSFSSYVSVGDSLAAGFVSGALVETHQVNSVPALLARQGQASDFQQPLITEPGLPTELTLVRLIPSPLIAPKASTTGVPRNLALPRPYNNLAVPGSTAGDALTRTSGGLHDVILRGLGTQVAQAVAVRPSLITLWTGNNDVLGAVVQGRAIDGVTLTPTPIFRQTYQQIVNTLRTTGATIVAANLPDVSVIPFATTIPPVVVNPATSLPVLVGGQPVPLLGPTGPLPSGSFVTLAASSLLANGIGIPVELGGRATQVGGTCQNCLPDQVILDPAEIASIRDHVAVNNRSIADICQAAGIPVLDVNRLLNELATEGRLVGGVEVNTDFLVGGFFSYDGVHPTDLGYAITANEWIDLLNGDSGSIPRVDLAPFMGVAAAARAQARGAARPAWATFSQEAYESLLAVFPEVSAR